MQMRHSLNPEKTWEAIQNDIPLHKVFKKIKEK